MLLAAVTQAAALAMLPFTLFLTSATQSSLFQLLLGVVALATAECRRDQQDQAGPAPGPAAAGQGRAGTLVIFAFRNSLCWIIGSNGNLAGIPRLSLLLTSLPSRFSCCPSLRNPSAPARRPVSLANLARQSSGHGTMEPL